MSKERDLYASIHQTDSLPSRPTKQISAFPILLTEAELLFDYLITNYYTKI